MNSKYSEYFSSVALIKATKNGFLVGGTDGKLAFFKYEDFEKEEDDIWPTNAQMDYAKSNLGCPLACFFIGDTAWVCGHYGLICWNTVVCKL